MFSNGNRDMCKLFIKNSMSYRIESGAFYFSPYDNINKNFLDFYKIFKSESRI